ncbi:MAG: hypothetical protein M0Z77_08180 [Thermoplasmatales archaeon]|jgi:hypothetical protein|nr:hypothetical protein [Candidatus Thermoplasmatota archaeon]MDA8055604.1 hypothetical protein [Thermoplasmatales archaeon]
MLNDEDRAYIEITLRDLDKDLIKGRTTTERRLGEVTKREYYCYVMGFTLCSILHTYYDSHNRDMTEGEQDEVVGILKGRIKEAISRVWGE